MSAPLRVAFEFAEKLLLAVEEGANVPRYPRSAIGYPHPRISLHLRKQEVAIKGDTLV